MVDTNVYGCALSIRAALGHFRDQDAGHMLLTGSVAGRRALPGSLYSATKWAVTAMGESLRAEVADTPIRVTLIEPGMVDTPFFDNRPHGRAPARRHRPLRDLRALPAGPRGRERDSHPAGQPAHLSRAVASPPHPRFQTWSPTATGRAVWPTWTWIRSKLGSC